MPNSVTTVPLHAAIRDKNLSATTLWRCNDTSDVRGIFRKLFEIERHGLKLATGTLFNSNAMPRSDENAPKSKFHLLAEDGTGYCIYEIAEKFLKNPEIIKSICDNIKNNIGAKEEGDFRNSVNILLTKLNRKDLSKSSAIINEKFALIMAQIKNLKDVNSNKNLEDLLNACAYFTDPNFKIKDQDLNFIFQKNCIKYDPEIKRAIVEHLPNILKNPFALTELREKIHEKMGDAGEHFLNCLVASLGTRSYLYGYIDSRRIVPNSAFAFLSMYGISMDYTLSILNEEEKDDFADPLNKTKVNIENFKKALCKEIKDHWNDYSVSGYFKKQNVFNGIDNTKMNQQAKKSLLKSMEKLEMSSSHLSSVVVAPSTPTWSTHSSPTRSDVSSPIRRSTSASPIRRSTSASPTITSASTSASSPRSAYSTPTINAITSYTSIISAKVEVTPLDLSENTQLASIDKKTDVSTQPRTVLEQQANAAETPTTALDALTKVSTAATAKPRISDSESHITFPNKESFYKFAFEILINFNLLLSKLVGILDFKNSEIKNKLAKSSKTLNELKRITPEMNQNSTEDYIHQNMSKNILEGADTFLNNLNEILQSEKFSANFKYFSKLKLEINDEECEFSHESLALLLSKISITETAHSLNIYLSDESPNNEILIKLVKFGKSAIAADIYDKNKELKRTVELKKDTKIHELLYKIYEN